MIKMVWACGALTVACAMAATPAVAASTPSRPSFACGKAAAVAERLICRDAELSRLDRIMADLYAQSLSLLLNADQGNEANLQQRAWLKGRNRCADVQCLRKAYFGRVAELARELPTEG